MQDITNNIIKSFYNAVSKKYSEIFCNELNERPLERKLLDMFVERIPHDEIIIDAGTGPGEIAGYMGKSRNNIIGVDISEGMIKCAKNNFPEVKFQVQDMLALDFKDDSIGGVTAFYAIVHFNYLQIERSLKEFFRVLKKGGMLLLTFHNGDETIHCESFHGIKADIDFKLLDPEKVVSIILKTGFKITERLVRFHYENFTEANTNRTIIFAEKI